jgi:hypothetical protein
MGILSLQEWKVFTGTTTTDATRDAAITMILGDVDAAFRQALKPFYPGPVTITDHVMDAPRGNVLLLPVTPARSITSLYLRWFRGESYGDPAAFTAEDLLTQYEDYFMPIDTLPENYSRSGKVYRRRASSWGAEWVRPLGRLASELEPARGAVKVTYLAGPASVPDDIAMAAALAASQLYARMPTGVPLGSESWNGYSKSVAAPFLVSFRESPDVAAVLRRYQGVYVGVG